MNSKISDKGLLLYFSTFDQIEKISDAKLGSLIKREMKWLSGQCEEEPQFADVRCDCLHSRLKEQRFIRENKSEQRRKQLEAKKGNNNNNNNDEEYQNDRWQLKNQ